ncbi:MAG: hypothetical protein KAV87_30020 [Desulfobacteraceae bacterium]|nr:hypothetical protein [Desulfobacteraceae bacterium]
MVERAVFNYVFSFVFDVVPLREDLEFGQKTITLGQYLQDWLRHNHMDHYIRNGIQWHQAEECESRESRSALYMQFHHLSASTRGESIKLDGISKASVHSHLALFESGLGIMWVAVDIEEPVEEAFAQRLISRGTIPVLHVSSGEHTEIKSVHEVFVQEVEDLRKHLNSAIRELDPNNREKIALLLSRPFNSDGVLEIGWIERDPEICWVERPLNAAGEASPHGIFQEPFITGLLNVSPEQLNELDGRTAAGSEVGELVCSLLHAVPRSQLDSSHSSCHPEEYLHNLFPDKRFKTYLHCNSLLVLHSEEPDSSDSRIFCNGLFRTFVAARGCWHFYAVHNEWLDVVTEKLHTQFLRIVRRALVSQAQVDRDLLVKRQEIIEVRGRFLRCMAVEDPLVRSVGMTPFAAVYDECSKVMKLDELRDLVKYKLDGLAKLFDMVNSFAIRLAYQDTADTAKRSALPILGIATALLIIFGAGSLLAATFVVTSPPSLRSLLYGLGGPCLLVGVILDLYLIIVMIISSWLKGSPEISKEDATVADRRIR